ncbi:cupin domain-containing protein [Mycobacterium sp. NPDC050041]|uniref:cupin domain-containing protein n=1 Tax=Mycobacterium sp. NPDC050041 TaxID=3364293 RepID=UPI003C2AC750
MSIDNNLPVGSYLQLERDGGERLKFLGDSAMRLKIDGADTADAMTFYEYTSEPGVTGPPQHIHHGHDETFYVVDGTYEFTFGAEQVRAEPGAFLYVPRGRPHTFRNAGHGTGRIVGTFAPARFAEYFRELAEIIDRTGGPPDRAQWAELYARYDTTFLEKA